ncbi:MAG TPA: hypothetical protein VMW38_05835 [Terriglobia bacterium]|nr:hypothetical protein [Terriglobia bacterium]
MSLIKTLVVLLCVVVLSLPLQAADFDKFEVYGGFSYLWNDVTANPGVGSFQPYYFNESNLFFGSLILFLPLYHTLTNPSGFQGLHGFEVSGTYNFKKWLGVEVGYQRHSGEQVMDQNLQSLSYSNTGYFITTVTSVPVNPTQGGPVLPTTNEYDIPANSHTDATGFGTANLTRNTILIGPKFSWRSSSKFTPFAHVQFGVSQYKRNNLKMNYTVSSVYNEYSLDAAGNSNLVEKQTWDLTGKLTKGEFSNLGFAMSVGGGVDWKITKRLSVRLIQADYMPTRHGFDYKYTDDFTSDISDYKYKIVQILQGISDQGPVYADYVQETRQRVIYSGTRDFSYSVPHQFLHNIRLSAGVVFRF